jgi:hypothetical protein
MDKKLKEVILMAKKLQRKQMLYINDNIEFSAELNYQFIAAIVENLCVYVHKDKYESIKSNEEELLYEMALSAFEENDLISDLDIEFVTKIIKEYINIEEPILIDDIYVFDVNMDKLEKLYEKALIQIKEGKFKNIIF